jgi:hypothetical protein
VHRGIAELGDKYEIANSMNVLWTVKDVVGKAHLREAARLVR